MLVYFFRRAIFNLICYLLIAEAHFFCRLYPTAEAVGLIPKNNDNSKY